MVDVSSITNAGNYQQQNPLQTFSQFQDLINKQTQQQSMQQQISASKTSQEGQELEQHSTRRSLQANRFLSTALDPNASEADYRQAIADGVSQNDTHPEEAAQMNKAIDQANGDPEKMRQLAIRFSMGANNMQQQLAAKKGNYGWLNTGGQQMPVREPSPLEAATPNSGAAITQAGQPVNATASPTPTKVWDPNFQNSDGSKGGFVTVPLTSLPGFQPGQQAAPSSGPANPTGAIPKVPAFPTGANTRPAGQPPAGQTAGGQPATPASPPAGQPPARAASPPSGQPAMAEPPPGYTDAEAARLKQGSDTASALANSETGGSNPGSSRDNRIALLREYKTLLAQPGVAVDAPGLVAMKARLSQMGLLDSDSAKATDAQSIIEKTQANITAQQAARGLHTDAGLAQATAGTPHAGMTPAAKLAVTNQMLGNEQAERAMYNAWQDAVNKGYPTGNFGTWRRDFVKPDAATGAFYDPQAFWMKNMAPDERNRFLAAAGAEAPKLKKNYIYADKNGWFQQ